MSCSKGLPTIKLEVTTKMKLSSHLLPCSSKSPQQSSHLSLQGAILLLPEKQSISFSGGGQCRAGQSISFYSFSYLSPDGQGHGQSLLLLCCPLQGLAQTFDLRLLATSSRQSQLDDLGRANITT